MIIIPKKAKMGENKKSGGLENIFDSLSNNTYKKTPPYKEGEKAGNWLSGLIDSIVDVISPKK